MLHQLHRDFVPPFFDGWTLGHTSIAGVGGIYIPERVFTLQAHPEFDSSMMRVVLEERHKQNVLSDEMYKEGMARVDEPHDGLWVSVTMWKFLLENANWMASSIHRNSCKSAFYT